MQVHQAVAQEEGAPAAAQNAPSNADMSAAIPCRPDLLRQRVSKSRNADLSCLTSV